MYVANLPHPWIFYLPINRHFARYSMPKSMIKSAVLAEWDFLPCYPVLVKSRLSVTRSNSTIPEYRTIKTFCIKDTCIIKNSFPLVEPFLEVLQVTF